MQRRTISHATDDDDIIEADAVGIIGPEMSSTETGLSWFWSLVRFCNTFAITILSVCVGWIFLQLQYVNYTLVEESDRIDALLEKIKAQQNQQINQLNEKVENNHSLTLYQMAGTFTLVACILTMFHMYTHLRNWNEPIVQRRLITILWMSPVYSVTSFLALLFPSAEGYLAVLRDFYEAYTVYNFLALLIAILGRGNREVVVDVLAQHADHLKPPTNALRSCYHPPPETSDKALANAVLYECQVLAMQFVFCRPLTSIANFVAYTISQSKDRDEDSETAADYFTSPNFFIAMLTNVTVFFAFAGLLKFYHAVSDHLSWCQPFSKFMAIKGIVFLTFWQGLMISILVHLHYNHSSSASSDGTAADGTAGANGATTSDADDEKSPHELAMEIQNILICLEMVFFSIAHLCVFPAEEWEKDYRPKALASPGMGLKEFASDIKFIMSSKRRREMGQAISISDSLRNMYGTERYRDNDDAELSDTVEEEEDGMVNRGTADAAAYQGLGKEQDRSHGVV